LVPIPPLSKSIDNGTDICPDVNAPTTIDNSLLMKKNVDLEFEQQIERNDICDCYYQDEENKSKVPSRCKICYCSPLMIIQKLISRFVDSKYFERIIFLAIIINTFSMAIEYHGQPQLLTNILEYINYVSIILFTIEMILKIIAEGCFKYIQNLFNLFDGGIVLISLIELYGTNNSGLSVLRTFRLLRVLKLVRFMPTLRRQLVS
jgi:hypothetical protein